MFHNIVYDFNETQLRPVSDNDSYNMSIFDTIKELKQNQNNMINELNSLSEICKRIDDTIKDIKEKLHQYDIDEPCESFDDNMLNEGNCVDDDNDSVINDAVNEIIAPITDNTVQINENNVEPINDNVIVETPVETPIETTLDNIEPLSIITHEADCLHTEPEKEPYSYKNKRSYGRRKK